jgi:hypothetical protein
MGVPLDSMTNDELSEAIPPAYSFYIAEAFRRWRASAATEAKESVA